MRLGDITYDTDFYWKGMKYKQVIRPKKPLGRTFTIICRRAKHPQGDLVDMPSGRKVKPVVRIGND